MSDSVTNYEKVSIYPLDPDVQEKLLSTQVECVFNWATDACGSRPERNGTGSLPYAAIHVARWW